MKNRTKAFTLVELIIVVLFIAAMTAITVPRMNFAAVSKSSADTQAKKFSVLMRRTRSLAIGNAAVNSSGYRLQFTGTSPYSGYQIINLATMATVESGTVSSGVSLTGGNIYDFGPLGNRLPPNSSILTVSAGAVDYDISVVAATGMVKCEKQ